MTFVNQNMLTLLYPVSYLLSLTGLILWFYFKDSRSVSRKMSSLFLISFLVYLFSLAFTDSSVSYKLLILFRDLAILGVVTQIFNYVRKHHLVVLLLAIGMYGLIQFAGFSMLYNTFPEINEPAAEANDEFELLVETNEGDIPEGYKGLMAKYNLTTQEAFHPADPSISRLDEFIVIGIPDNQEKKIKKIIRELRRLAGTRHVEYNETFHLEIQEQQAESPKVNAKHVNDPMSTGQWGWDAIQGDRIHEIFSSGKIVPRKKALIAILDSGVDAQHEVLAGQFRSSGAKNDTDPLGHGTHCAGIAAAVSNNQIGIASLVPTNAFVEVTSIKVLNSSGLGNQQATIQGIIQAADMGADVISLSLGSLSSDSRQKAYNEAVKYANAKGAIVVASAGNANQNAKGYSPANAEGIIAVTALGTDQRKASFSNTVDGLQYGIAAPGMKILSTYPYKQYKEMNGTSMAAPMVSGLVGMLKAFNPSLTTKEVYEILSETGKQVQDGKSVGPMIQASAALERVLD